jgi:hypothetical protein
MRRMDNLLGRQKFANRCEMDLPKPFIQLFKKQNQNERLIEQTRTGFSILVRT